jgi:primary-amine oxidase
MSITTVGNYDYSLAYVFGLDGAIKVEVGLSGILLAKGVPDTVYNQNSPYGQMFGTLVSPNIITPNHQHFFCFRLDLDVDGQQNTVSEMDMWSPPKEENRHGNAIEMDDYEWFFENEAHGDINLQRSRKWVVRSTTTRNILGGAPAYMLVPGSNAVPYLEPDHVLFSRAGFLKHHVWATRYKDAEMYAAGMYPSQSVGGDGVVKYAQDNESIRNKDVVLWYTMGISHHPRPEEWPIMNTHQLSFKLEPMGFFDRNPALFLKP